MLSAELRGACTWRPIGLGCNLNAGRQAELWQRSLRRTRDTQSRAAAASQPHPGSSLTAVPGPGAGHRVEPDSALLCCSGMMSSVEMGDSLINGARKQISVKTSVS